ncbi:GNAT family N-acetyltransferase [Clostridium hydrogeniformans]|uniref:GNAT family N-acetyltransferase n=1 Tax=Clostridium hydrogeniformans TaxID=349933 RepID=UPI0004814A7D|nr:GNAT family N-acetyltransferase [Clostridium hydrogeniformans]
MIKLLKDDLHILYHLDLPEGNVDIHGYIQGVITGQAWVNKKVNPTMAILVIADFCILIRKLEIEEEVNIKNILLEHSKGKLIIFNNPIWYKINEKIFNGQLKAYKRYSTKWEPHVFHRNKLNKYILEVEKEFNIIRIDEGLYYKSLEEYWTADFCSNFLSKEKYLQHGVGYVVMKEEEIISGASSYSYCEGAIDISIETKEKYRGKGLATACASKVILECLDRGIYPKWDASNLASLALAKKLGYTFNKEYFAYFNKT